MSKKITDSQITGEIGEAAARKKFLELGFQFDLRGRLEAGIDAVAEVMVGGAPQARMIAVQVKATQSRKYSAETSESFSYRLRSEDLSYWRKSNIPVIIVLYRRDDESFYWRAVTLPDEPSEQLIKFDKAADQLNHDAVENLIALTVPKTGDGIYVPPRSDGEDVIVNILPVHFPKSMFVCQTSMSQKKAVAVLLASNESPRFDWIIHNGAVWSFHNPTQAVTRLIVSGNEPEKWDADELAYHDQVNIRDQFKYLLKRVLSHQFQDDLRYAKDSKALYFRARGKNKNRIFEYQATVNSTKARVVNVSYRKDDKSIVAFVRHHALKTRFECFDDEWAIVLEPTYHFTYDGFTPHSYPDALLSGKKRLDTNSAVRGQVIMWAEFLRGNEGPDLLPRNQVRGGPITFGHLPILPLSQAVPETAWKRRASKKKSGSDNTGDLFDEV